MFSVLHVGMQRWLAIKMRRCASFTRSSCNRNRAISGDSPREIVGCIAKVHIMQLSACRCASLMLHASHNFVSKAPKACTATHHRGLAHAQNEGSLAARHFWEEAPLIVVKLLRHRLVLDKLLDTGAQADGGHSDGHTGNEGRRLRAAGAENWRLARRWPHRSGSA